MNRFFNLGKKFFSRMGLVFAHYWSESYSQEGEDMLLKKIFEHHQKGFYVDIGAHHPQRFSNTYYFYRRGWQGINIDALPGSMIPFRKIRPRDINIEAAISQEKIELTYYIFEEPAINTLDPVLANERIKEKKYRLVDQRKITTTTLAEILASKLPANTKIDFFSIDVEGLDLEVLSSNDWNRFRPDYIVVECFGLQGLENIISDSVYQYLTNIDYSFAAKTLNTCIFKNNSMQKN